MAAVPGGFAFLATDEVGNWQAYFSDGTSEGTETD